MAPVGDRAQGTDPATLELRFGSGDPLVPLWIAEPDVDLAPAVVEALRERAAAGWYGYEIRPESVVDAFWDWMAARHGWDRADMEARVSPSVGTSLGVLIRELTDPGDGVIIQPPVYTDFKPLVAAAGREPVRNPLGLDGRVYTFDLDGLAAVAAVPTTRMLILCSPHNPVGRVWRPDELTAVARICADHDVFVVADEIHADIVLPPHEFVPFAAAAAGTGVRWAATHGPIKTFGLAGVCDTLLVTGDEEAASRFSTLSSQLHLARNNVFGLAAFEAGYREGEAWLDDLLGLVARNVETLRDRLSDDVDVFPLEGTFLAWLDLRCLGLDVQEIPRWLASEAGLALSPGHWFGREGAGFARMTIAAPIETIERAADALADAVERRR